MAVLPCTITKSLGGRFLLSEESLERIFRHVLDLHDESVKAASPDESKYIAKRMPSLEISYLDGTKYELSDLETFKNVVPGKGRRVKGITVSTTSGDLTANIKFYNYDRIPSFDIRSSGPEDRISYFVETIVSEVSRERDITVFARRIWPFLVSLLICTAVFISLSSTLNLSRQTSGQLFFLGFPLSTMILMIPIEILRSRWLPPIAYLWGQDGKRANLARVVVTACLITFPIWLIGTLVQLYIAK